MQKIKIFAGVWQLGTLAEILVILLGGPLLFTVGASVYYYFFIH